MVITNLNKIMQKITGVTDAHSNNASESIDLTEEGLL